MVELKTPEEHAAVEKIEEVFRAIQDDPKLSPHQKKLRIANLLSNAQRNIAKDERAAKDMRALAEKLHAVKDAYEAWRVLPPKLEKNDCSRLHQLIASLKYQERYLKHAMKGGSPSAYPWHEVTPFVVTHDWASAFDNATDYADGTFNLPLKGCAFEFRISGHPVTVLAGQEDKEHEPSYVFYVGLDDYWVSHMPDEEKDSPRPAAFEFAIAQVKAICVALDAEVATRRIVRVDEKVNRKRVKEGREPFYSYHVIDLNRRYRIANPSGGSGTYQGKKRLHFRRGHWRHYAEFKTWVRWTLVGNPELGFIEKEYRL